MVAPWFHWKVSVPLHVAGLVLDRGGQLDPYTGETDIPLTASNALDIYTRKIERQFSNWFGIAYAIAECRVCSFDA